MFTLKTKRNALRKLAKISNTQDNRANKPTNQHIYLSYLLID